MISATIFCPYSRYATFTFYLKCRLDTVISFRESREWKRRPLPTGPTVVVDAREPFGSCMLEELRLHNPLQWAHCYKFMSHKKLP